MAKKKKKHIFRNLFLLTLLGTTGFLGWQLFSHGTPPSDTELVEQPHRLTILTWNTNRLGMFKKPAENEVLAFLTKQNADVICLQEVDVYKDKRYLTLQEVRETLGRKYPYSYLDFVQYDQRHQYGTMVWSKYPLTNKKSIHYRTRGNLSNRCDMILGSDTIRLINNHLESYMFTHEDISEAENQRNYTGVRASYKRVEEKLKRAMPLRNEQARVVREEMESSPYLTIVVGDFNATTLSYAYRHISRGWHDAWTETGWLKWGATCEKRGLGMRIDYIISSPRLIPVNCQIGPLSGSDHKPVSATLAW